jgi:hypothetical protein
VDTEARTHRERITDALQEHAGSAEIPEGSLLTGWVVVTEWMAPDGDRWLEGLESPDTTGWTRQGMLHTALSEWSAVAQVPEGEEE